MLDLAAGNGDASLAAARRWCDVISTDYVPALLEHGRASSLSDLRCPDVLEQRRDWFASQLDLDPAKLVFVDETGASTSSSIP